MKKFSVFFAMGLCCNAAFSQTLINYGNNTTGKEEFLRAYNKNKQPTADKEKSMRDYLELYTNFKLKVKAAEEVRLDTIAQIRYDIQNFRDQITDGYLSDEKGLQLLTDEAAERSAKDLHVIYFSVPVAENATPADTMKAYTAAKELYNTLKKGTADYANAVTDISAKIFPATYNDIGFITAFSVKYDLENILYNTKPGSISEPYRSTKGWSIFKVTEERPDVGKWKVAQILLAYPPNADFNTKLDVKQKADSVYGLIKKGLSFSEAAKQFSDDRLTYLNAGEMPEFGTGKYSNDYEKNVFKLQNDNDISKPFETAYGYHIVKRLSRMPLPPETKDPSYQFEIKQSVIHDARINREKEKFTKEITRKTGYQRVINVSDAELYRYADTVMKNTTVANTDALPVSKKTIIRFKDGTQVKGEEWLKFVKEYNSNTENKKVSGKALLDMFAAASVVDYYKKHLEDYNNDFKYQMQEFKEGNMLFEIMERNVWSKAGADSAGLLAYYNMHKENYKWNAGADVLIFNCTDEKKAEEVISALKAGKTWMAIAESSNNTVQADSGRYELAQIPGAPITNPLPGSISPIIKNTDGTAVVVKFIKLYEANLQRSFPEAKGLVINDYQNILEVRWLETLRKKYPVKINEEVFKKILN